MAPPRRSVQALGLALAIASATSYSLGVQSTAPRICARNGQQQLSEAAPLSFPDELLLASKGDGGYNKQLIATIGVGLHCVLPMATISSVLLDGDIARSLELTSSQVVLSDSLIFGGWVPGAALSGPVSDALGRKGTSLAFAALAAAAMAAQTLLQPGADAELQLCALRALAGFAVGGYLAPAFSWLVESVESGERGRTGTAWTLGYVVGVAFVALLHVALPGGWRAEEAAYSACVVAAIGASALLVTESPRWLFAVGDRAGALDALRSAARRSGPDAELRLARAALDESAPPDDAECLDAFGCELGDEDAFPAARPPVQPGELLATQLGSWRRLFSADGDDGDGGADGLRATTLSLACLQLAFNVAFYALLYSSASLSDALVLNFVLLSAADVPGAVVGGWAADALGAKAATVGSLFLAGASITALALLKGGVVDIGGGAEAATAACTAVALVGKTAACGAFLGISLLTAELYPTDLRSAGLGFGGSVGKVGAAAAAPLVSLLPLPSALAAAGALALAGSATAATLQQEEGS